jgi:curli biogenesis system outer membrane secretion channel CsgG
MRSQFILWIVPLLITGSVVLGSVQVKDRSVTGNGRTPDEAVINGLLEAIRQVRGVQIDTQDTMRTALRELSQEKNGEAFSRTDAIDEMTGVIRTRTNGVVDSYDVLDCTRTQDGQWEAKLRVAVAVYSSGGDPRKQLAVLAIRARAGLAGDNGLDVQEIARQITARLTARIVQSQYFRVPDREYGAEFEKERSILFSGNVAPRELARLGEQLGSDYLLTGTLSEIHAESTPQGKDNAGVMKNEVILAIDMRVVEFATRQVRWAETVTVKLARLDHTSTPGRGGRAPQGGAFSRYVTELAEEAARRLNQQFLDALMPIFVLDAAQDEISLNQGGARLAPGEQLSVLGPAREVPDPGTGALVKVGGHEVAKVEVTKVQDRYSTVRVLSGEAKAIRAGLVCRRLPCPKCAGTGVMVCDACAGRQQVVTGIKTVERSCEICKGSGRMRCPECNGTRQIRFGNTVETCSKCRGAGQVTCENCDGTGKTKSDENVYLYGPCKTCAGSGLINCPLCRKGE